MHALKQTHAPREKAFLVGVAWKQHPRGRYVADAWPVEESLVELERLADTAGLEVVGQATQSLARPHARTFIGSGKAEEIAERLRMLDAGVVIFDDELSPRHQRELEALFGAQVKVIDRTGLILDIFALHADTREGALQVELAQYEYRLPRLTQTWTQQVLTRQAGGRAGGATGGVGLRGPGETRLEIDQRVIRRRISQIKEELEEVRAHRAQHRARRRRSGLPTVALVGYTNAGKSTLLNALSDSDIYVADQLFATLDPTTRRVELPDGAIVLISDTVGFIQKLPTRLIAAFRATLESLSEADLMLHVIDVSHPRAQAQAQAVYRTLREIGVTDLPIINVLNKVDRLPNPEAAGESLEDLADSVAISARTGYGLPDLLECIEAVLEEEMVLLTVIIPFERGELVSVFHERGLIYELEHLPAGTKIAGRVPLEYLAQFEDFRVSR
ncbi:MAG: GTPase HflX [Chloroflexota bacterium]|nr:GTPase HflX [Chloroflexota bacterium]